MPVDNLTNQALPEAASSRLPGMDDDPIPPLLPIHEVPPLRTQVDLHRQWRAMMGPLGFSFRRLWLLFLDRDDRPTPVMLQIDDVPEDPDPAGTDSLLAMCREVREDLGLGRVAVLLSRPGADGLRVSDRRWGRALLAAAGRIDVPLAPLHLADDERLVPLTGDDLLASA